MKRVLLYGAAGGVLIALLKVIEYKHFIQAYPSEVYGGLIALIFTAVGIYLGLRLVRVKGAPGDPEASYLYQKVTGAALCGGERMPRGRAPLDEAELALIEAWICGGAQDD